MKQMKKYLAVFLAFAMLFSLVGCQNQKPAATEPASTAAEPATDSASIATDPAESTTAAPDAAYQAGTYEGIANGMGGELRLSATFDSEGLQQIEIGEHTETPLISDLALTRIPADIVACQSLNVDTVSGSTITSNAVLSAVADTIAQAGGSVEAWKSAPGPAVQKQADETTKVDVLVIGGGLSGMSAAFETASAGLETLLLEKLEAWGGSSARSGGAVCYATEEGDAAGYFSAEDFYQWFRVMGHGQINDRLVRRIADVSGETVEWMRNSIGYNPPYEMTETFIDGTVARLTNPGSPTEYVTGCGGGMMQIFYNTLSETDHLSMMNRTKATALLTDENGAVTGALAERADGSLLTIEAGAVVLATGGWAGSETYMDQWAPGMKKAYNMAGVGCDGDGIALAESVGAGITFDTPAFAGGLYAPLAPTPENFLLVDGDGNRFTAEDQRACFIMADMMRNPSGVFYAVFNEAQAEGLALEGSAAVRADSIKELASQIGVEAAALQATIDRYNELAGCDDADFGKAAEHMTGIDEGPYYAVPIMTYILTAYAGPDISEDCQVLSKDGAVIPGLYGIGELIATNIYGYDDGGHGATLQYCMSTGRFAAAHIISSMQ